MGYVATGPGAYQDRAQLFDAYAQGQFLTAATGPHAATNRLVYTVPPGRRASLLGLTASLLRDGVAAAPSYCQYKVRDASSVNWVWLSQIDGTKGAAQHANLLARTPIESDPGGSDIVFNTIDVSGDGTYQYVGGYHVGYYNLTVP